MAIILLGHTKCPLCQQVLLEGDEVAGLPASPYQDHPLYEYFDQGFHKKCFDVWDQKKIAEELVNKAGRSFRQMEVYTKFNNLTESQITDTDIDFSDGVQINELQAFMDGGSVRLICETRDLKNIEILVVQRMLLKGQELSGCPGALYFNNQLVGLRSALETKILKGLKRATFNLKSKSSDLERQIFSGLVEYIQSEEYIEVAKKVGRIAE